MSTKRLALLYAFSKPEPSETADDIAIHNIKACDEYLLLEYMCTSINAWMLNDKTRTIQDAEKLLRKLNLNTHLIASLEKYDKNKLELVNHTGVNDQVQYVLKVSARPKEAALKEVIDTHGSYESNFEKLARCGILRIKEKTTLNSLEKDKNVQLIKNESVNNKIYENAIKLNFQEVNKIFF